MFSPSKLNEDHSGCMMVPPPVSQQFCLKWNDHSFNLVKTFSSMAYDQNFVDVTLACEGSSIKAHKVVLSACSNYFKELFLSNPCKHPIVILKDIKMDDLKAIVDFMYKGEINVFQHQLGALLKTAEILKVKGLTEAKDDDDENKLNQEMREMDKENEPVNSELPRAVVGDHATILTDNECHMNGVSVQTHYQSQQQQQPSAQPSQPPQPLSSHLAPQQHPIQQISSQQQQPFTSSQPIAVSSTVQIQSQVINNGQPLLSLNQQQQSQTIQQGPQQHHQQPPPSPVQKQPTPTATPTSQQSQPSIQSQQNLTPPQSQQSSPPPPHLQIKPEVDASQQIHSTQLATQQQPLPQQQHKQAIQPRKRRRRRSKRSVDSSSIEEGSGSDEVSGSASGDDDSVSGDSSISKRLKPPAPPSQGNSLDHSNHSLTSRRRQPLALPPPPPPPVVSSAIQSHRELVNNSDYGHLDDSSETWQDGEQMSMNNQMGDASEESNGMIDIKPIVSFDEGSVGASMNNMSVSSENMIVAHMDYPSLSPGSTGSTPSNPSNTGKICRCQHCGLTFTAYSSLRRHMQRHFADRERYVCDICLKSYSRKDYLKEHKKLKHPTT